MTLVGRKCESGGSGREKAQSEEQRGREEREGAQYTTGTTCFAFNSCKPRSASLRNSSMPSASTTEERRLRGVMLQ